MNIATKVIKENGDIFSEVLRLLFNGLVNEGIFLQKFLAELIEFQNSV